MCGNYLWINQWKIKVYLFFYQHTKTYCTSNNQNKNKNTLRTNRCSLYRRNFLEIDLFSSSGYVLMDMTNSALSVLTKAMFDF